MKHIEADVVLVSLKLVLHALVHTHQLITLAEQTAFTSFAAGHLV